VSDYVIDTHALVFHLAAPRKLGKRARGVLRQVDTGKVRVLAPAAVLLEIALLHELGRVDLGLPEVLAAMEDTPALQFLPVDLAQVDVFAALTAIRDPFDRLIVSAARATGAKLISRDEKLQDLGVVSVVWA
jgi:PIN domain nuclease of toxin-antitoxin system